MRGLPHVSIHAPREGCDLSPRELRAQLLLVSIHAPREGCDSALMDAQRAKVVSIHAPREGCDSTRSVRAMFAIEFQFTHPGRGATRASGDEELCMPFQFTHPGRGATVWCKVAYYRADKQA